ncbi:SLAP domain-containing protein [Lactobacillus kalixensis]|uniref:Surface layer protein A domain-containing protein n=1 Tax=Lactobacillus kalixensis DSM 16043 TaxID=1423763 RepID=A0A0R1UAQ8_9LACO|nr:SLAP domain-containing protein [Lactobacillus kalixensis]KRL90455.1 hypothetical protein FC46_GL001900 [Lactobacillus kalixensis DSM 16043]
MLEARKIFTAVTGLVLGLSLLGVGTTTVCADTFNAPKLGISQIAPTDPAIKKGDKIFVIVKDTDNQTVEVYNQSGEKTGETVDMGTTYTNMAVKKINDKKMVQINKNQWLNIKDVVKE